MSLKPRGGIPYVDPDNPQSWGRDDYTGLPVMHPDMVKQMEYFGTGLAWTGFMVHHKDADQPNPQKIPPRLKVDPVPIPNPRYLIIQDLPLVPDAGTVVNTGSLITGVTITATTSTSISISWISIQGAQAYVVSWYNNFSKNEVRGVIGTTYTITNLAPGNPYFVQVASTSDNSTPTASEFSTSAFSVPVYTTLPTA